MTIDFWTGAERFYDFWFVIFLVALVFILFAIIFTITYTEKENRTKVIVGLLVGAAAIFVVGILGNNYYKPYLEQNRYINPLMRDRTPSFTGYSYFGRGELTSYSQLNDLEALQEFVLYEEEIVTETVDFLGKDEHYHYFELENDQIVKYFYDIQFKEEIQEAQFVGSRFFLKDDAYKEIGFMNPENIMFQYIGIPTSEQDKVYEPDDPYQVPKANERMFHWNF